MLAYQYMLVLSRQLLSVLRSRWNSSCRHPSLDTVLIESLGYPDPEPTPLFYGKYLKVCLNKSATELTNSTEAKLIRPVHLDFEGICVIIRHPLVIVPDHPFDTRFLIKDWPELLLVDNTLDLSV